MAFLFSFNTALKMTNYAYQTFSSCSSSITLSMSYNYRDLQSWNMECFVIWEL
uniref:Uncharacterized protein n=1 Tax=Arundo donax TaxID=35708 RepID=A0A0A9G0V3_ARUDO